MRPNDGIDYQAVLADLRDRRTKLDTAIAAIEQLVLGLPSQVGPPKADQPNAEAQGQELPARIESDTFFNLTTTAAAEKYLRMKKKPAGTRDIERALLSGGFLTSAKSFYSNLYTAIMRSDTFVKVGKKWGLAEWYPGKRVEPSRPKQESADKPEGEAGEIEGDSDPKGKGAGEPSTAEARKPQPLRAVPTPVSEDEEEGQDEGESEGEAKAEGKALF